MECARGQRGKAIVIQRRLMIVGRVQGVCFRASTFKEAQKYPSLCGYVRNQPDGTVEVVIAGKEDEVLSMVTWCKKGPALAKVSSLTVREEEYRSELKKFHVAK